MHPKLSAKCDFADLRSFIEEISEEAHNEHEFKR
jgi:hypothetical protein